MVIITKIYEQTPQTKTMVQSFKNQGYEVAVLGGRHYGNGSTMKELYECYKRALTGHETFCYSDGGDTYCQRTFEVPNDKIIYSTEKALYPNTSPDYSFKGETQWKYLNGGGYCGSLKLIVEFFEKYGLTNLPSEANGQKEQHEAFLKAKKDGFPIELDYNCNIFQSIAFMDGNEFEVKDGLVINKITGSTPAIIHANGRTETPKNFPFKIF